MKAFPADFLSLFQMLSDDTTAEILFNIKSDPKSKTSITNPNFDEMVNYFKEEEIDISSVYDFMEEKNLVTNLLRNKTKEEKIEIRRNIAKNLKKLIEGLGERKSRDKTQRLLNGILADDSQSKANIVALNVFLKDSTNNKLKIMKNRYINPENRAKLIEIIEKKESKKKNFTPKDFYNEKIINLTRVLIEIRAASSEIDENSLNDEAEEAGWEVEMSGNLVILRKIVKFQRKIAQSDIKKLIDNELPSLRGVASTEDVKMRSISSDLRRLLYETDSSFVNIGSSERIKALTTKLLESFGTIEKEEIENWFKLVMEGAKTGDSRDANFMKEITNFKIRGKSMYQTILSGKVNSSKHTPSFYIRKLLELPIDSNLFDKVMKELSAESVLTRKDLIAWKKQSASTKKQKQAIELDAKKAPDTEERQAFEQEYFDAVVNSVAVIFIEYMIDEADMEIDESDYTIINPQQAKESQKAIFNNSEVAEEIQAELLEILEDEDAEEEYRDWLKSEGYSFDSAFYKKRKLTVRLNEEQQFLQGESEIVKTIYSILGSSKEDADRLRNHFEDNKLKDAMSSKGNSIEEALSVFYHICNLMSSPLIGLARKIDTEAEEGLTVENESLLQAVRDFATKMQSNLQLFKSNFTNALKERLDDIAEKPVNYPTIYDSPKYADKLVSYALMKRREL